MINVSININKHLESYVRSQPNPGVHTPWVSDRQSYFLSAGDLSALTVKTSRELHEDDAETRKSLVLR